MDIQTAIEEAVATQIAPEEEVPIHLTIEEAVHLQGVVDILPQEVRQTIEVQAEEVQTVAEEDNQTLFKKKK